MVMGTQGARSGSGSRPRRMLTILSLEGLEALTAEGHRRLSRYRRKRPVCCGNARVAHWLQLSDRWAGSRAAVIDRYPRSRLTERDDLRGKLPVAAQLLMHADLTGMCTSVVMAAGHQSCLVFRLCSLVSSSLGRRVLRC